MTVQIPKADWRNPRGVETAYNHARKGYYGGRCQVFRPYAKSGYRYDINSAYPAALVALDLPCGPFESLTDSRDIANRFERGDEGIFTALVNVPNMHVPPLPVRGKGRIYYPTGKLYGSWAGNELRYALSTGVAIEGFLTPTLVWKEKAPILRDFCQRIWNLRDSVGPKTPLGKWLKLLANNVYGKLAQHPEVENAYIVSEKESIQLCPADAPCLGIFCSRDLGCCPHWCFRTCGREFPLDSAQLVRISEAWRMGDNAHIHWAAYLTAFTRITLHRQLVSDGADGRTAVYCDTDSVYSTSPRTIRIGDGLGQWKYEGRFWEFHSLGPKSYSFIDAETGEFVARCKGIPDPATEWESLSTGRNVMMDRGVQTFKTAARNGQLFKRKSMQRSLKGNGGIYGDRIFGAKGLTYPQDMAMLRGK